MKKKREGLSVPFRPRYLRLSEHLNALDYLERTAQFVQEAEDDLRGWKWAVIALHGALYGFAICACQGSNPDNVLNKKGRLIDFWTAIRTCRDRQWMGLHSYCDPLELSAGQERSIKFLADALRNPFMHFIPMGWTIEVHGLPRIAIDVLQVIRFLALNTQATVFLAPPQRKRAIRAIEGTVRYLKRTRLYREQSSCLDGNAGPPHP
jgi:hypothetical protein